MNYVHSVLQFFVIDMKVRKTILKGVPVRFRYDLYLLSHFIQLLSAKTGAKLLICFPFQYENVYSTRHLNFLDSGHSVITTVYKMTLRLENSKPDLVGRH